jgi:hypothetical protein
MKNHGYFTAWMIFGAILVTGCLFMGSGFVLPAVVIVFCVLVGFGCETSARYAPSETDLDDYELRITVNGDGRYFIQRKAFGQWWDFWGKKYVHGIETGNWENLEETNNFAEVADAREWIDKARRMRESRIDSGKRILEENKNKKKRDFAAGVRAAIREPVVGLETYMGDLDKEGRERLIERLKKDNVE